MKKKISSTTFIIILWSFTTYAQDTIQKKDKKLLIVTIKSVDNNYVHFKEYGAADTTDYQFDIKLISSISYKNGQKISYQKESIQQEVNVQEVKANDSSAIRYDAKLMFMKGENDGFTYYIKHKNVFTGNYFAGIFVPITILVPLLTSFVPPEDEDLAYPSEVLYNDLNYRKGYLKSVMRMKRIASWTGYGVGNATLLGIIGIVALRTALSN